MRFRTKLLLCMVWILALSLGVGGTLLIQLSFQDGLQREKEDLLRSYQMTASVMAVAMEGDGEPADIAKEAFRQVYSAMDWSYAELSLSGAELFCAGTTLAPEPEELAVGQCEVTVFSVKGTLPEQYCIQLCAGIGLNEQRLMVTLVRDITDIYETRGEMLVIFRKVYLITLAVGALISLLLATALTRPLGRVSKAARQMAQGDLSVRLKQESRDEVGDLSRDFNHMADKLQENIHAMEETMAAQERFMGSFAHELKTPMTSIIGYADLLRSQALDPKEAQEAAGYIFSEGKRLESLSLKLLELHLAKHERPEFELVEVSRLVTGVVRELQGVYKQSGIQLEAKCQPGAWQMDPVLMSSVLMNLADNARKAMEHGGVIGLLVDFPGNTCRIRVVDNGRGMPQEAIDHLTEAFYRVDKSRSRAQGGAGLGLSLCQEIVRYHGGELKFESKLGKGTCVSVILKEVGE